MVAISTVICDKNGKIIFARQFFKLTRMELEEYIVHFSRGIDNVKEVTHFESEKVRYLFIPFEDLYLILITTKNSNIIEDTEILKLIHRLIQDICGNDLDAEKIVSNAFEIMLGIDDIVTLGYRNSVNLSQLKQYLQMESVEEKEFKRLKREKELKQQKEMYEKGREFDRLMRKQKKLMGNAISSSTFNFEQEENKGEKNEEESTEKELNITNKNKAQKIEEEEKNNNEEEEEKPKKKIKKNKAKAGGLKLTKRKNYM